MSYFTQSQMTNDRFLIERSGVCAATLGLPDGLQWAARRILDLVVTPGWVEAYMAAGGRPEGDPAALTLTLGSRPDVITDAMILEAVRRVAGIQDPPPDPDPETDPAPEPEAEGESVPDTAPDRLPEPEPEPEPIIITGPDGDHEYFPAPNTPSLTE